LYVISRNSLTMFGGPSVLCVRLKSEIKNKVADLFEADLSNLEIATKLFSPENVEVARALRRRHENELDFTKEAENLRECTRDMQKHGVEPSLVRIPRVVDEICTPNVLAMEYLEGISLVTPSPWNSGAWRRRWG
jgi:predicted unusual protein kinase regulating ubiquinone biosynthesis (AarF/ABC1/UbiB family)